MPNREGGYGGYQSSQPQQNRMPRKVNAPGSGKVRRGVDPAGLGAQRPPQRPTRPAQQPPEPPPRRRTAERPAAQPQPVHRAALEAEGVTTIKVADDEEGHKKMEDMLKNKEIDGAVTMHFPFPIGVSTVGRVDRKSVV